MHCINYAKREQKIPQLFKLALRSCSTLSQAQFDSCHELLVVFGPSALNSNRTNHKPRKKLANQKHQHMSLRLCWIRTRYCALIRRCSMQKVQSICDAGKLIHSKFVFLPKYFNVSQFAGIQLKASLISSVVEYCLSLGKLTYVQTKQLRGNCLSAKQPRVVCLTISDIDRDVSVA